MDPVKHFGAFEQFVYDAANQREASFDEIFVNHEREAFQVIRLFKEKKEYRISLKNRTCTTHTLDREFHKVSPVRPFVALASETLTDAPPRSRFPRTPTATALL